MDSKIWWQSRTILGAVAMIIIAILDRLHIKVPDDTQDQIVDILLQIGTAASASLTIYGRIKANTKLTLKKPDDGGEGGKGPGINLLLVGLLSLSLMGCGETWKAAIPPKPKTPAQAVYLAKGDYDGLLKAAGKYNLLPRCDAPAVPVLCSDKAVVEQLRKADFAVQTALDAAEATVRNPQFGQAIDESAVAAALESIAAFKTILKQYGVQL